MVAPCLVVDDEFRVDDDGGFGHLDRCGLE